MPRIDKHERHAAGAEGDLSERLLRAALDVRESLRAALDAVVPPPRRPNDLVQVLGLDKSLASRLQRAADAHEPIEAVLDGAGTLGLRTAIDRMSAELGKQGSTRGHAAPEIIERLRSAVSEFSKVCELFPEGRTGLEAAMAAEMPEIRAAAERKARRSIFQSHTFLLGFFQETVYKAFIRVPSRREAGWVDIVYVELSLGYQVLRAGSSGLLAGVLTMRADDPSKVRFETLDGELIQTKETPDVEAVLLKDRCSHAMSDLHTYMRGAQMLIGVPATHPALGTPVDVGLAHVIRCGGRAFGTPERPYDTNYVILRKPVRTLIWDEFCDPSIGSGAPDVSASFASGPGAIPPSPQDDNLYRLHQEERFESLGVGLSRLASRDVPDCRGLIEGVLNKLGIDGSRLSAHRLRIEYPVAHTRYVVWNRLLEWRESGSVARSPGG